MDEMVAKRLEKEGWPKECVDSYRAFGSRVSCLYPLIGLRVTTPKGRGVLVQALGTRPRVLLDKEARRASGAKPTGTLNVPGLGRAPSTHDFGVEDMRTEEVRPET